MRILMLSKSGDGLGIAHKMVVEGHTVDVWIQDADLLWAGRGLVGRPISWRPLVRKADLIMADMVGFGKHEKTLRGMGKVLFSISLVGDTVELDRKRGIKLLERSGIKVPESVPFPTPKAARDILSIWREPGFVVKPSGNIATGKTYIVRDKETYGYILNTYSPRQELVVQHIIEGIEISTEGWWNGRNWVEPFNHTFEEKRFLPDRLGSNTGCMGNVVIAAKSRNKLIKDTVLKLEPFLKKSSYKGPIDINCIVNKTGASSILIVPSGTISRPVCTDLNQGMLSRTPPEYSVRQIPIF